MEEIQLLTPVSPEEWLTERNFDYSYQNLKRKEENRKNKLRRQRC